MSRAVPAVGRALDILELFLHEERLPARYPRGRGAAGHDPTEHRLGAAAGGARLSA